MLLRRRRLGSVEENFIKQLRIGDLFVLGGRIVRLIDAGVQEAYVERADGQLPTVPRWNAAKMPLTSGLARAVRQLRTELDAQIRRNSDDAAITDCWWKTTTFQRRTPRRSWNCSELSSAFPIFRLAEKY